MNMNSQGHSIRYWDNGGRIWKGKRVVFGFEVVIDEKPYYLFIGERGRGNKDAQVPLYCELAMPEGASGRIMAALGDKYADLHAVLPRSLKSENCTSYIFQQFKEGEYARALQCMKAVFRIID